MTPPEQGDSEVDRIRARLASCEAQNAELTARLADYERRSALVSGLASRIKGGLWLLVAGKDLDSALGTLFQRLYSRSLPLPEEAAAVVAAVIRRLTRVGMFGLIVVLLALVPDVLLGIQTHLIAQQNRFLRAQNEFLLVQTEERRLEEQLRDVERAYGLALQADRLADEVVAAFSSGQASPQDWARITNDVGMLRLYVQDTFSNTGNLDLALAEAITEFYRSVPSDPQVDRAYTEGQAPALAERIGKSGRLLAQKIRDRKATLQRERLQAMERLKAVLMTPEAREQLERLSSTGAGN